MTQQNDAPPEFGDPAGLFPKNPEAAPKLKVVGNPIEPQGGMPADRLRAFLGSTAMITRGGEMPAVLADVVKLTAKLVEDGLLQIKVLPGRLLLLAPAFCAVWLKYVPGSAGQGAQVHFYVEPHLDKGHDTPYLVKLRLVQVDLQRWVWQGSTIGLDGTPPSNQAFAEVLVRLFTGEAA